MKSIPETFRGSSSGNKRVEKKVIDIILHGGVVSDIIDIPVDTTVRVWDYDIQGESQDNLHQSPYDENRFARLEYWE